MCPKKLNQINFDEFLDSRCLLVVDIVLKRHEGIPILRALNKKANLSVPNLNFEDYKPSS